MRLYLQKLKQEIQNIHIFIENQNEKNKQMLQKNTIEKVESPVTNKGSINMSLDLDVNEEKSKTKQKKKSVIKEEKIRSIFKEFEKDCEV